MKKPAVQNDRLGSYCNVLILFAIKEHQFLCSSCAVGFNGRGDHT